MNTHRALIETSVPPSLELIAAGNEDFCREHLSRWRAKYRPHGLDEYEVALIVEVKEEVA